MTEYNFWVNWHNEANILTLVLQEQAVISEGYSPGYLTVRT